MMDRSFLFVPGNRPDRFEKACAAGADVVIVDLEDAVAPEDKEKAREAVRAWLSAARPVYLRINGAESEWFAQDLALVNRPGVRGVVLPKTETDEAVRDIHRRAGTEVTILPLIESAVGLWHAETIAAAPGVERLAFGSVDFQLDTGITGEREELLYARSRLVIASRIGGCVAPVDGVTLALDDEALLRDDVDRSRRLGFGGKLCVHPNQVAIVNAGFTPPDSEVALARRIVEAAEEAGNNAVRVDGKLVDLPVIARARAVLARGGPA
jgi:citrate lyase subunit beta/citryl-CoA lyase